MGISTGNFVAERSSRIVASLWRSIPFHPILLAPRSSSERKSMSESSSTLIGSPVIAVAPGRQILTVAEGGSPASIASQRRKFSRLRRNSALAFAGATGRVPGAARLRSRAVGPCTDCCEARTFVRDSVHVVPVRDADPELDDPADEDDQRKQDQKELDHRLTALAVRTTARRSGVAGSSHETSGLLSERSC